jgi:phosphoribosylformylglycinamidine synthase
VGEVTRIEVGTRAGFPDSRGASVERRIARHLGWVGVRASVRDVYLIEPGLSEAEASRVAQTFAGPVLREAAIGRLAAEDFDVAVSVGYKPGVTDPVAKSARVAIEDLLGRPLGDRGAVYTSKLYLLTGVDRGQGERIARELLANEVIERIHVDARDEWLAAAPDTMPPRVPETGVPPVEELDLERSDEELLALSRERLLALTLPELHAIRDFYRRAAEDPRRRRAGLPSRSTDVELECLAQTWSEHCKHKIMNATIRYREPGSEPETIRSLFKTCIKGVTERIDEAIRRAEGRSWLVSVFHDNAGVIEATPRHHLVYKVETHNSPSALDPYGGAITGIVGVNRDPFGTGMGAELLCNVWGYCFAPPDRSEPVPQGLLHPRRVREGVHQGVIDGGNQSGIPYARGFEIFDERFLGKPLVYCGTVGRMPHEVAGRPAHEKGAAPGDRIVMVGGRIGKDGIHGATFSSAELTEESPIQAVQIGDPITQKMMFDFLLEARDRGLYSAITDNGAGGLSSSVGEMAESPGGAWLDLSRAPLKYAGLAPWEILLSEAQERMTVAVPQDRLEAFLDLAARREVEATDLGAFTDDGYLECRYGERVVGLLPLEFLHHGLPEMRLEATWSPPPERDWPVEDPPADPEQGGERLAALLASDNMASAERLCRRYDHEVKGLTVIKPWVGFHRDVPSDATVLQVDHHGWEGYALAEGIFPRYSDIDAGAMAEAAVDLAVRRLVAAGTSPRRIAALDNFCWPDPLPGPANPEAEHKLAQLVRASRGLARCCEAYGVPLISGKDSMKNDAVVGGRRISVPPTLLVSAIGLIDDVRRAMTLEPACAGHALVVVGEARAEFGGSEWATLRGVSAGRVPRVESEGWADRYRAVAEAIREGLVDAAHAIGRGGLLPGLFFVARAGACGVDVDLEAVPGGPEAGFEASAYGESLGRFVLVCRRDAVEPLLALMAPGEAAVVGSTIEERELRARWQGRPAVRAQCDRLAEVWQRQTQMTGEQA